MASMQCLCIAIGNAQAGRLRQAPARRGARSQRRAVAPRAGLLDTLIKPITSSGEVGGVDPVSCRHSSTRRRCRRRRCWRSLLPTILLHTEPQRKPLKEGIANFYDESSQLWENIWVRWRAGCAAFHVLGFPTKCSSWPCHLPCESSCTRWRNHELCMGLPQGEHMHHGYYPKGGKPKSNQQAQVSRAAAAAAECWLAYCRWSWLLHRPDIAALLSWLLVPIALCHSHAQIDMIEETLRWARVEGATKVRRCSMHLAHSQASRMHSAHARLAHRTPLCCTATSDIPPTLSAQMVDVGCGIGGSSRHIARKYGCAARGITLSPVQVRPSGRRAVAAWSCLADQVTCGGDATSAALCQPAPACGLLLHVKSRAVRSFAAFALLSRRRAPMPSRKRRAWGTGCPSKWGVRAGQRVGLVWV